MDKLLLHTAIALKKNGQKEQAREFFKTVIEAYPVSTSASTAKRYLKSLK
jgi:TolA-binding protein